jgi:hypothetical protein
MRVVGSGPPPWDPQGMPWAQETHLSLAFGDRPTAPPMLQGIHLPGDTCLHAYKMSIMLSVVFLC